MKIVFATQNPGKIREIREILGKDGFEVVSIGDLDIRACAEENGETFSENAEIKAREIYDKLRSQGSVDDIIVMADDSGFCIDELSGAPGVHSARFMGHDTSYDIKNAAILEKMKDIPEERRGAEFVCSICAILPDGKAVFAEGSLRGRVAHEIRGKEGFGYDPIFYLPQYGKTTAELGNDFKNSVSHRSQALHKMEELIRNMSQEMDRS